MPIDYTKYPSNWFTEIRPAILARAKNKCEQCSVENYAVGYRDQWKRFIQCDEFEQQWAKRNNMKLFKIVLTVAHLNHNVDDNRPENLKALCQMCHLNHDRPMHILSRKRNASLRRKR